MKQSLKLKGTERGFFSMYVGLMSIGKPLSTLRKQEKRVLAELMYMNYELSKSYVDREDPKKWNALFDYDTKMQMKEYLNMTEATFANSLTSLRKVDLLSSDNYLKPSFRIYPSKENSITFEYKVKEEEVVENG